MVIGDKVRMLHGNGEGVVIRVMGETATVMLNEGIEIPVPKKQLVIVRSMQEHLPAAKSPEKPVSRMERARTDMLFLTEGVYLAAVSSSAMLFDFYVVNQSDYELFVLVYKLARPANQFHADFRISPKSAVQIPGTFPKQESNHLIGLAFQLMKFHPSKGEPVPCIEFRLAFSRMPGGSAMQRIPVLEKEGILLQLDGENVKPDAGKIRESMLKGPSSEAIYSSAPGVTYRETDLHIEALTDAHQQMESGEILAFQLRHFEKQIDDAMLQGVQTLVVIHGVGNGILRNEIHRRLAQNRSIKHFKDARREKFGYGATEIAF